MPVRLNSSGGGSVTLDVPATSGTFTVNLPAANGDVVVTGGGSTVQFGAGSAAAPSITFSGDTNTGIYSPTADTIAFTEGGVEAMRIDSAGRVGIGTPNPISRLHVDGAATVATVGPGYNGGVAYNNGNQFLNLAAWNGTPTFSIIRNDINTLELSVTNTGAGVFAQATLERMRIDPVGNVGIGTTAPAARLDVNSQIMAGGSAGSGKYLARNSNGITIMDLGIGTGTGFGDSIGLFNQTNTGLLSLGTNGSDRLRIDRDGNVMIGKLSVNYRLPGLQYEIGVYSLVVSTNNTDCIAVNRETADGTTLACYRAGSFVGGISVTTTNTSFNTSSDYRLKENVAPLTGAAARVQALKPSRFNFIADPDRTVDGFIAHEAAEVVPEAVTGEKDAVDAEGRIQPQGIDQSKLVPLLTAALQEALSRIETLEARLAAVEAR